MKKALRTDVTLEVEVSSDPDKGTEQATKFRLGSISTRIKARIRDEASQFTQAGDGGTTATFNANQVAYRTVMLGLKGWRNFQDPVTGQDAPFRTHSINVAGVSVDACTDDTMSMLDLDDIRELAEKINDLNTLAEEERKNSEG